MQEFMTDAGQEGVLLVAFGTIAELGVAPTSVVRALHLQVSVSGISLDTSLHEDNC